ncbi:MAG: hypothetical protein EOO10_03990 [Chitinophagaceae bacterium]|nr:MAG: hypothetical protein EOO10_03990 [Chitinophagaceae bacterium]
MTIHKHNKRCESCIFLALKGLSNVDVDYRNGNFATLTIGTNDICNIYPARLDQYGNTSLGRFITAATPRSLALTAAIILPRLFLM